jgi:hypothetical protein
LRLLIQSYREELTERSRKPCCNLLLLIPFQKLSKSIHLALQSLPTICPVLELLSQRSESKATGLLELWTFQELFTQEVVDTIVNLTNSYAENRQEEVDVSESVRQSETVNSTEI